MVMADGQVEPLRFPGAVPELLIPSPSIESDSVVVLPDSRMDLRLSLEPYRGSYLPRSVGVCAPI